MIMKAVLVLLGLMLLLLVAIVVVGAMLPQSHTVRMEAHYAASATAVWDVITDYRKYPEWRGDVRAVEALAPHDGLPAWRERTTNGDIRYETVEAQPPRRLVTRIADPKLPFGGTWTYQLTPDPTGCTLTITENGEVYNPLFRFISRYVMGQTTTMDRYLRALGRKFGEQITTQEVH
jgi:uncharacterized protein YndB with AHSA1/START domain